MKNTRYIVVCAGVLSLALGGQQAIAQQQLRAPAELPPAEFQGKQFADSTGCIFIRAGAGGAATWVPRVTRDSKHICGFEPTFSASTPISRSTKPAPQIAILDGSASATAAVPAVTQNSTVQQSQNLDTLVLVADGTGQASQEQRYLPGHLISKRKSEVSVKIPKGYRRAWGDDRLNTRRAEHTLEGQRQMRKIWTDTVPRRLID